MENLESFGPTEYEIITHDERLRRDPRCLVRLTLLSDGMALAPKTMIEAAVPELANEIIRSEEEA